MTTVAPERSRRAAVWGLLLGLGGVLSYFLVAFRLGALLPEVRNTAAANWVLIGAGLALSAVGVRRAGGLGLALALVNAGVAAGFAWLLYGITALPPVPGLAVGAPAPNFALIDPQGKTVGLADLRGAPALLVFYRGHW